MKAAHATSTLGLMALAAIASASAVADDTGWYIGGNIGQSRAKIDDERITSSLSGNGFATTSISNHDRDIGGKILGGYQLNRNFALEGGYFDLGKFGYTATTVPTGTLSGNLKAKGLNLDLVGILPITEKFSAFGRAGLTYSDVRDSFSSTGMVHVSDPNPSKRAANYKFGVGLQYDLTEALAARTEVERYRINDAVSRKGDVDLVSVGLVYRFGTKSPAPVAHEPMPEPVVVAVAPKEVVVEPPPPPPPPAPPARRKVSFSADSLFEFNQSNMKPAGKQDVDKLAADLKGARFDVITVTGHTDRIGSHDYNMKLSTRRAEAVKTYLVESVGIPADKVSATGVNGSDPVTKPEDCVGTKPTKKLIACLQPDRRVDVEVTGTK